MKKTLIKICQRGFAIFSFIFAFVEISSCFALKVFLYSDSPFLRNIYINYIAKLTQLYIENVYFTFAVMIGIFIVFSRGMIRVNKFIRFNVIQAILLDIICSCISAIYPLLPLVIRESGLGLLLSNFFYLGTIAIIIYSSVLIIFGRYPKIPVVSDAARLQVQRGWLD